MDPSSSSFGRPPCVPPFLVLSLLVLTGLSPGPGISEPDDPGVTLLGEESSTTGDTREAPAVATSSAPLSVLKLQKLFITRLQEDRQQSSQSRSRITSPRTRRTLVIQKSMQRLACYSYMLNKSLPGTPDPFAGHLAELERITGLKTSVREEGDRLQLHLSGTLGLKVVNGEIVDPVTEAEAYLTGLEGQLPGIEREIGNREARGETASVDDILRPRTSPGGSSPSAQQRPGPDTPLTEDQQIALFNQFLDSVKAQAARTRTLFDAALEAIEKARREGRYTRDRANSQRASVTRIRELEIQVLKGTVVTAQEAFENLLDQGGPITRQRVSRALAAARRDRDGTRTRVTRVYRLAKSQADDAG